MKYIKLYCAILISSITLSSYASDSYKIKTMIENKGQIIGSWNTTMVINPDKNTLLTMINVVNPKKVNENNQSYDIGFNIKMNLSHIQDKNLLSIFSSFSSLSNISLSNDNISTKEDELSKGQLYEKILNPSDKLKTIIFKGIYDVTIPRNIDVIIGKFIIEEKSGKSPVYIKIRVEK